jgi:hypothetical protein
VCILLYVGAVFLFELVIVKGEGEGFWRDTGVTRTVYYYVTQSGGDAFLHIDHDSFSATSPIQPFQMTGYDITGGLIYNVSDRLWNSTHRENPSNAWFEFWSDDQTMLPSGSISFYQINASTINAFANYTHLRDLPTPWLVGTVPLVEFGRGSNPYGWEGWRDGSARFLESAVNKMNNPYYLSLDNDTLALKYHAIRGNLEYFATYDANASRAPRIGVEWEMWEWIEGSAPGGYSNFQEMYEGFYLWWEPPVSENRTGEGADVNWNLLNQTQLTEIDSGNAITVNNETWTSINAMQAQQIDSLYNDTGGAGVNSFFVRFAINVSAVTNNLGAGSDQIVTVASLSTATPVGGGGLGQGNVGDWIGVYMYGNADDVRYMLRLAERSGAGTVHAPAHSGWFNESDNERLYCEFFFNSSVQDYIMFSVFSDPDYSTLISNRTYVLTVATPPFRYPQIIASLDFGNSFLNTGEVYTYLEMPLDDDPRYTASDENGTELWTQYPGTIDQNYTDLDDLKDDISRLLGGIDPTYDRLPGLGDTFMILMGMMGMIMIPASFLLMGHSIKEGDWVTGFYYLLMFFFVGLGFVTVWLFG